MSPNGFGQAVNNRVYFVCLVSGEKYTTRRILFLRKRLDNVDSDFGRLVTLKPHPSPGVTHMKVFNHACRANTPWWLYVIFSVAVTYLCFASVSEHGLYDHDAEAFRDNSRISADFSYFFSSEREHVTGRPAADLSRWLASLVIGNSKGYFHLLVVVVHAIASILLARFVFMVYGDLRWAFVSGQLFLVNVTHFQAVHHISALDYPLSLTWALLGLLAYLRYDSTGGRIVLVATYAFFSVGTLTHMAVAALGPLCILWHRQRGGTLSTALVRVIPLVTILIALVLYGLAITPKATSTWSALDHYGHGAVSPFNTLHLLAWFTGRLFSTAHWVPPLAIYEQQPWEVYFGAVTLAALCVLGWFQRQRVVAWTLWIVLCLLPFLFIPEDLILKFLPQGPSRYLYLASAGSSVLIAAALVRLSTCLGAHKDRFLLFTLAITLISSYCGIKQVEGFSHYTSGRYYASKGEGDTAIIQYQTALAQGRDVLPLRDIYYRLCNLLIAAGRDFVPVLDDARSALPSDDNIKALFYVTESLSHNAQNRDTAARKLDDMASALQLRDPAEHMGFRSTVSTIYHNLGLGLASHNDDDRALISLQAALIWKPGRSNTLRKLYKIYLKQGLLKEATEPLERLVSIDSTDFRMYYVLGQVYAHQHEDYKAMQAFEKVLKLSPNSDEAFKTRRLMH